jgi:hypothetical protein
VQVERNMRSLSLLALRGRPVVVARAARRWSPRRSSSGDLEALFDALRPLGAVLVVRSDDVVWCVGPGDEVEECWPGQDLDALDAVTADARIVVLDPAGEACFCRTLGPRGSLVEALTAALRTADRYFALADKLPRSIPVQQWLMATMVSSFAAVFREASASIQAGEGDSRAQGRPANSNAGEPELVLAPRRTLLIASARTP